MAKPSRLPDDTVFFSIIPDSSLSASSTELSSSFLHSLHLELIHSVQPFTSTYIWQHESFSLSISPISPSCFCSLSHTHHHYLPHLHGKLRFGDNLEDEWFTVFLLFHITKKFPSVSVRVWDNDGEFLLIESAFYLPRWINPENSQNRVFIRQGDLHIIPRSRLPDPTILDSLRFLIDCGNESRASEDVQTAVKNKISDYPERAQKNMHNATVRVPVSVAQLIRHEPCLISLAVEAFYDRDVDTMKYASKMEMFLGRGKNEELVQVSVRMSRAMYAQLVQQTFQAPKCYPMPTLNDGVAYKEAELGMKITCGFEMVYQQRKKEGAEGKGSTWSKYKESLDRSDYFGGSIPGSKEYKRLMEKAEENYKTSSLFTRTSETMSAPVTRIHEILALQHSADDFKNQEVVPDDDDSWLYNGEDELNSTLQERQKEMEIYNSKPKKKQQSVEPQDSGTSSNINLDLGDIAKTMQQFVNRVSSYEGAEVPNNSDLKEVELDVDRFFEDMVSVMRQQGHHEGTASGVDGEDGSSSDMEFDDYEEESDTEDITEDRKNTFMHSYSDALNEQLNKTTLQKSFVRANDHSTDKDDKRAADTRNDMEEDFSPVDVDVNLVKSLLDSFSSQEGLPGPASNLLGLLGLKLPKDSK